MKSFIQTPSGHSGMLPSLFFICLVFPLFSEALVGREKPLGELTELPRYNAVRIHYHYNGVWTKPVAPIEVPPAYEATIRSYVPVLPTLRELFNSRLVPVPPEEHPGSVAGVVSIDLFEGYDIEAKPDRRFTIQFFLTRKEVQFNGKLWRISPSFWAWLNKNFAFSGIDIHIENARRKMNERLNPPAPPMP